MDSKNIQFEDKLNNIIKDNLSGSTELLLNIIDYFIQFQQNYKISTDMLNHLKNNFKEFQIIQKFLDELGAKISLSSNENLEGFFKLKREHLTTDLDELVKKVRPYLINLDHIITISNSFTLLYLFDKIYSNKNMVITIMESRPNFEGRIMAEKLSQKGFRINLITEAMLSEYAEKSDAAIIGIDNVLSGNSIVNKTGSRNLAIICKYFEVPLYAVGTADKVSEKGSFERGYNSPEEIWEKNPNDMIQITNFYFEKVDTSLITKLLIV